MRSCRLRSKHTNRAARMWPSKRRLPLPVKKPTNPIKSTKIHDESFRGQPLCGKSSIDSDFDANIHFGFSRFDFSKITEDIVTLKRESYKSIGLRNIKEDEYVEQYFREHLIPLWPPHWMRFDDLRREFMKGTNRKPKENKKPTDTSSKSTIKLPPVAKKPKPATITSVTALNNNTKALDLATTDKPANKVATAKTDKRLSDITSKVTGTSAMTAVISTVTLTPTEIKCSSTTNLSNKVR